MKSLTSVSVWLPGPAEPGRSTAAAPRATAACSSPETVGRCAETELKARGPNAEGDDVYPDTGCR